MTNHTLEDAAIMLSGLVRAFELHADANPDKAPNLRRSANTVRRRRDAILKEMGLRPGTVLDSRWGTSEWAAAIKQIALGNSEWDGPPSRDEWLSAD